MTSITSLAAVNRAPVTIPRIADNAPHAEHLGDAIAELAARLHAATYDLLVLLRQFDEACGWNTGFRSCAHWLHWRTGIDLGAAREKVRVAKALAVLPRVSAAMQRGEVSYAKVRAVTRVATPENEAHLVDVARCGTAAHVERLARAWRRVDRVEAARQTEVRHLERHLTTWVDDDGMVVLRGRLTPEVGAVVQRALEAAADRLFHASAQAPRGDTLAEDVTAGTASSGCAWDCWPSARSPPTWIAARRATAIRWCCMWISTRATRARRPAAVNANDVETDDSAETCTTVRHARVPWVGVMPGSERSLAPDDADACAGHAVLEVGDGAAYVSAADVRSGSRVTRRWW